MRHLKKYLFLLLMLLLTASIPAAAASQPAISKKAVVLIKGQKTVLKLKGTDEEIIWKSSRPSVASVNASGKVTAKKKGEATITAKSDGKKYTCRVTVQTPSLSKKSMTLTRGAAVSLKLRGTDRKVSWKSSNQKVAAVSSKGRVTAKKAGTAMITATVLKKTYTCKITVKKPSSSSGTSFAVQTSSFVWIPRTGTKYHRTTSCSGMKSPAKVTKKEAVSRGYEPCKKCY